MKFDIAKTTDSLEICELINLAYRSGNGWTTELGLVEGDRCDNDAVMEEINTPNSNMFVYKSVSTVQACISVKKIGTKAYIGSFAVHPQRQNSGLGTELLEFAEEHAVSVFKVQNIAMVVLSKRKELIEYYERRGYTRNGNIQEYPLSLNVGTPIDPTLTIEELIKYA